MSPKFSIIIPVYNVAPYIRECLDSVLAQTYTDWEAICVDDGSTDGSSAILDEYAAKDARFRVIHQVNAGVSAARNAALDVAQGEWVGFVDGDDAIDEEWMSVINEYILNHIDIDFIRMSCQNWCGGFRSVAGYDDDLTKDIKTKEDVFRWGYEVNIHGTETFRNVYKRKAISGLRFIRGVRYCEDAIFSYDAIGRVSCAGYCGYNGYYYRRGREGAATASNLTIEENNEIWESILDVWERDYNKIFKAGCVGECQKFLTVFFIRRTAQAWSSSEFISEVSKKHFKRVYDRMRRLNAFYWGSFQNWRVRLRWRFFLLMRYRFFLNFSIRGFLGIGS